MSRFNTLYLADAESVADELQDTEATNAELTVALINTLGMVAKLREEVDELREQIGKA